MIKKIMIAVIIITIYVIGCFYSYLNNQENNNEQIYLKSVIFQTDDSLLVPVSLNFYNELDLEQEIINRIDMMKSNDFKEIGLYPLLDDKLSVNYIDLVDNILNIDFNEYLIIKDNYLNLIEALSYIFFDYEEVEGINITINGNEFSDNNYSSALFKKDIGINNFYETDGVIHHTIPVDVYHIKKINNKDYFVPITTRINDNLELIDKINQILTIIDPKITCNKASFTNNKLVMSLNSDILVDDGIIDKKLYKQISLTFSSLNMVDELVVEINNEEIFNSNVSMQEINYIKI